MTTQEVIMTMGKRENFMCRWFKWLPPELKAQIMKMIPGWKRELSRGDFVKFKMNIPVYESYKWNECFFIVNGLVSDYIFSEDKKVYEYCIEMCDKTVYDSNQVQKSVFWRPIGDEVEIYNVKDEVEKEELMKWHLKIAKRRGYFVGLRRSRQPHLVHNY